MKNTITVQFNDWLPDYSEFGNPGVTAATNVYALPDGYAPFRNSSSPYSDALNGMCRGIISVKDSSGSAYTYSGDDGYLYSLSNDTWSDVSKSGTSPVYSLATDETWEFAKWGEKVIAVSGVNTAATNNIQVITLGGSNFADLGGGPPQARHIAVVRDFVVVGNTWDSSDGLVPNRVRWSAFQNEASWTVSAATQADFQDLLGRGGYVQRVTGGEYGVIFQEASIWRMSYVGSPLVWQFDEVLPGKGTPAPGSVTRYGDMVFFLSQDGFEVVTNGSTTVPIGANKIDRYFWSDFDTSYQSRMSAVVDPTEHRVIWAYPGVSNSNGFPNRLLIYDWVTQKWSITDFGFECLANVFQGGYTLDQLDSISSSLDALTESLDSRFYSADAAVLSGFTSDNKLQILQDTGDQYRDADIRTADLQLARGRRSMITRVRPIIDGLASDATVTVTVRGRNEQGKTYDRSKSGTPGATGRASVRLNARYHQIQLQISGEYTNAQGLEIEYGEAGQR